MRVFNYISSRPLKLLTKFYLRYVPHEKEIQMQAFNYPLPHEKTCRVCEEGGVVAYKPIGKPTNRGGILVQTIINAL